MPHRLPTGAGIGLRRPHFDAILASERELDFLEIIPENFIGKGGRATWVLDRCAERWPVLAHGVSMSIGGPDPLDHEWLAGLRRLLDRIGAPFYTDHLCWATLAGLNTYDLLPLPFHEAAVRHVAGRLRELADALERPVAIENISYYATMPGSELDEGSFVRAVVEEADCKLLLDVNNVYVNACNHPPGEPGTLREPGPASPSHDALVAALERLPLDRACQIHLAGHVIEGPRVIDNHGAPVCDAVWSLYQAALDRCGPVPTLIEWDSQIPALELVLDQADLARARLRGLT